MVDFDVFRTQLTEAYTKLFDHKGASLLCLRRAKEGFELS